MATKKLNTIAFDDDDVEMDSNEESDVSDFDDDLDPDNIEVPGGGKDLETAAAFAEKKNKATTSGIIPVKVTAPLVTSTTTSITRPTIILKNASNLTPIDGKQIRFFPPKVNTANNRVPPGAGNASTGPVERAGGINNFSPMIGNNASQLVKNLQQLIAANPAYLTSGIPTHLIQQMWKKEPEPTNVMPKVTNIRINGLNQIEEEEGEDEEMGVAETYADYWPAKLKIGKKHPDPVVETASLSSVEPSNIHYKLSIPSDCIEQGMLSALQLEAITYTCQAHECMLEDGSRAGFLVGDGAGVGKGRTIAGIIYENYLKGRKRALWISVSNDLKYDAQRDLRDIGAGKIQVHALNKFKYAKINSTTNGNIKKGIVFSTYSAMIGESNNRDAGKYKSRLKQLLQWCGEDFDGVIVFDECHKAKNLCPTGSSKPTKTGLTALELQNKLPKARVVYASATGASEPRNMAYMVRLGIWGKGTPFPTFLDFITAVEKRGVGAMELVAMDMKLRGGYIARQLSFQGVAFKIDEVQLSKDFKQMYDDSVELWVEAMHKFTEAAELISAESRMKKTMWGQFWSAHQRFFKYLCIASKVQHAVTVAREAIKYGKCVVIGLQSTGEARTLEQLERDDGELTDFVSTAKGVIQSLVEKHFPAPDRNRINRLLGWDNNSGKTMLERILEESDGKKTTTSGQKRKTFDLSNLPQKRVKRSQLEMSDDDADDFKNGSDFAASGNESSSDDDDDDDDDVMSDASEENSDYNPFGNSSDSESDPWVSKQKSKKFKKEKKEKKTKKKKDKETNGNNSSTADIVAQALMKSKKSQPNEIINISKPTQDPTTGIVKISVLGMSADIAPIHIKTADQSPPKDNIERACEMKEELLRKIEKLGDKLPPNTLDQLIDELGGPENVAEMTGRKGRVVQNEDGSIQYESRSEQDVPLETLNLTEKQRFMDGEKDVAIISEAASSGISLQSDRRVRNQRRRVHITLELPWSADRAIQQFGRTHRSNQVSAPEYIFLISDLAGERRFASTVAKRLESLGALTHGDRRATESRDLSQFNIDNKYGRSALEAVMKTLMGYEKAMVPPPVDYKGDFFRDIAGALVGVGLIVNSETSPGVLSLDKDYNSISKFLNRILGMPVELQNRLFKYFTDTLAAIIGKEKRMGRFDLGILDLGAGGQNVKRIRHIIFLRKHSTGIAPIELQTVHVERGMIWQEAMEKWADLDGEKEGFYLSHQVRNGSYTAILAIAVENRQNNVLLGTATKKVKAEKKKDQMFQIYRPNTGLQVRLESLADLEKKYKKVDSSEADKHWIKQYDASVNTCSHTFWSGTCRHVTMGYECEVGLRRRTYSILSGSVLSVWGRVENILSRYGSSGHNKMQVIRLKTQEGKKIVGTVIPKNCVELIRQDLSSDAEKVEEVKVE
ncbi:CLUMA_CG000782, isoform A [Clunio marinus]|uniref:CLUMA_CG000782, isoform A n=1 Tax=Clunio marinus TaxID=568069 RepID=A0A1J1HKH9_9DIPT|nr:CLUMA_CG000782, isoform A [Clunio marinus]